MSGYVWECKTCGHESPDGPAVKDHCDATGHIGSRVRFDREDQGGELPRLFRATGGPVSGPMPRLGGCVIEP